MAPSRGTADRVLDVAFAIVAVVAGIVGVVMLVAPGSTGDYFSWELGPPPLASLVGGLYVASTAVFGLAISKAWGEVRGLVAAVLALTLPTLAATLIHSEVFDFSRPVAVIWLILFVGSPMTYGSILLVRRSVRVDGGPLLPGGHAAGAGRAGRRARRLRAADVLIAALAGSVIARTASVESAVPTRAGRRSRLAPWR